MANMMKLYKEMMDDLEQEAYERGEELRHLFCDELVDQMMVGNSYWDVAKYAMICFEGCKTEREFEIANEMFCAFTGWNIDSFLDFIEERLED